MGSSSDRTPWRGAPPATCAVDAGVAEHSSFEERPSAGCSGPVDYVSVLVSGGRTAIAAGRRLREHHKRFTGTMKDGSRYSALEPGAYAWVHATLIDTYVRANARFGRALTPEETQRFYREYKNLGRLVGIRERDFPPTWPQFRVLCVISHALGPAIPAGYKIDRAGPPAVPQRRDRDRATRATWIAGPPASRPEGQSGAKRVATTLPSGMLIRDATPERDAAACAAIYAPYVTDTVISLEERPPTEHDFTKRIENTTQSHPWLVAQDNGDVIGYAYATRHRERASYRWAADVAVYVAQSHHRRGVGRKLYETLFPLLVAQGLRVACAGVTLPNDASVGLHEALGFEPVGVYRRIGYKHGAWRDVGWWQLELTDEQEDPRATPREPGPPARLDRKS